MVCVALRSGKQLFDGVIVSRLGEMVEADGQGVGGQVRGKIGLGIEDLTQQRAGIVGAGDMLAKQRCHAGFGAIGDHLDGIDEVLALGAQTSEAIFLRQWTSPECDAECPCAIV